MSYGMIPEFVGRFPIVVNLEHLDRESLVNVLTQPKNALVPQYVSLLKMDQVRSLYIYIYVGRKVWICAIHGLRAQSMDRVYLRAQNINSPTSHGLRCANN